MLIWEGASQGQEALISYGQQSNDRLLQFYGFVEPKNPADTYVMTSLPGRLQASLCPFRSARLHRNCRAQS